PDNPPEEHRRAPTHAPLNRANALLKALDRIQAGLSIWIGFRQSELVDAVRGDVVVTVGGGAAQVRNKVHGQLVGGDREQGNAGVAKKAPQLVLLIGKGLRRRKGGIWCRS